jgi:hypothetical protein
MRGERSEPRGGSGAEEGNSIRSSHATNEGSRTSSGNHTRTNQQQLCIRVSGESHSVSITCKVDNSHLKGLTDLYGIAKSGDDRSSSGSGISTTSRWGNGDDRLDALRSGEAGCLIGTCDNNLASSRAAKCRLLKFKKGCHGSFQWKG